jgi:uncharacterized membrane protein YccF (DUF307 family)
MSTTEGKTNQNPGCLVQVIWFFLVGVWLGEIWTAAAWILMVSVIGLPFGVMMINRLPKVVALREPERTVRIYQRGDGTLVKSEVPVEQVNLFLRILYFVLVGWWFSALWMQAAYALCATVIGLPLGFYMFDCVPSVLSLHRD